MKNSNIQRGKDILLLFFFLVLTHSSAYSYSACSTSAYLNVANLQCSSCLANQIANTYQIISTSCQCSPGYLQATNNAACTAVFSSTCSTANSYYPIYTTTGTTNTGTSNCQACSSTAYSNRNQTRCLPCGTGMTYSSTQGCVCSSSSNIRTQLGCFQSTITPSVTTSKYSQQLKYLIPACATNSDYLSCSQIINLCTYSQGDTSAPECQFFNTYSLTSILYGDSLSFSLTAAQSTKLSLKVVSFAATGNYLGEKTFVLGDIMRCGTPSDAELGITFGTNIQASCSFDFNSLINQINSKRYQPKLYQLLIQGDDQNYYDVPIYMTGSSSPLKRIFLQDAYTYTNKINVLTSFKLQFTFAGGKVTTPRLTPTYTLLSTEIGTGVVGTSKYTLSFDILFSGDLSGYWTGAIASFIVVSILAVVHTIVKTYIGYLNRKSALQFFSNLAGVYSLWLFYYLLGMTGYWFLFTKTTSSPFLLLPLDNSTLYSIFYALVAIMVTLRLIWAAKDKSDKLSTEVYLINWEKGQFKNSWREIFIVNSLAEFYTYRTFSLFWMLAVFLFFMTGVGWESLSASTASTASSYQTLTPQNRLLLYFLACSVFLAIGIVFKLLRRLSVLFWPYPFQDFVDYCTVTNISFVFIKRRAPQAYYLHAALPDRTDVTYRQINQAIRRGLQKNNRSISNEISSIDSLRLYSLYLSKEMEDKHTLLIKRIENQEHAQRMKYTKEQNKKKVNLREEFIETRLKPHIEGIPCHENDRNLKSFLQNFCGTPPIDLREDAGGRNRSSVYFDDNLELVNEVFPNGNEFQQIHTLIVIFLGWVTLVNSCPIAAFLTYLIDQYVIGGWIAYSCRANLEEMTKVKRGFMI